MARDVVNPTRMELQRLKRELKITERGYRLLKDKQDELIRLFMEVVNEAKTLHEEVSRLLVDATKKLNDATARTNKSSVYDSLVIPSGELKLNYKEKNVMSVIVPVIEVEDIKIKDIPYSFHYTSASLDEAVVKLKELAPKLIKLAEIEKRVDLMSKEIENTRRRVNAIEHIRLPNLRSNIKMIVLKLDDHERFNTVRMMKSKDLSTKKNKWTIKALKLVLFYFY